MPKAMEEALKRQAKKKGYKGKRANAFIYGTLRKTGWKPERRMSDALEKQRKRGK